MIFLEMTPYPHVKPIFRFLCLVLLYWGSAASASGQPDLSDLFPEPVAQGTGVKKVVDKFRKVVEAAGRLKLGEDAKKALKKTKNWSDALYWGLDGASKDRPGQFGQWLGSEAKSFDSKLRAAYSAEVEERLNKCFSQETLDLNSLPGELFPKEARDTMLWTYLSAQWANVAGEKGDDLMAAIKKGLLGNAGVRNAAEDLFEEEIQSLGDSLRDQLNEKSIQEDWWKLLKVAYRARQQLDFKDSATSADFPVFYKVVAGVFQSELPLKSDVVASRLAKLVSLIPADVSQFATQEDAKEEIGKAHDFLKGQLDAFNESTTNVAKALDAGDIKATAINKVEDSSKLSVLEKRIEMLAGELKVAQDAEIAAINAKKMAEDAKTDADRKASDEKKKLQEDHQKALDDAKGKLENITDVLVQTTGELNRLRAASTQVIELLKERDRTHQLLQIVIVSSVALTLISLGVGWTWWKTRAREKAAKAEKLKTEKTLDGVRDELVKAKKEVEQATADQRSLRDALREQEVHKAQLEDRLAKRIVTIPQGTGSSIAATANFNLERQELEAAQTKNRELTSQNTALTGQIEALKAEQARGVADVQSLEAKVAELQENEQKLKADWERDIRADYAGTIDQLNQDRAGLQEQFQTEQAQKADLERQFGEHKTQSAREKEVLGEKLYDAKLELETASDIIGAQSNKIKELQAGEKKLLPDVLTTKSYLPTTDYLLELAGNMPIARILISRLQVANGLAAGLASGSLPKAKADVERDKLADELRHISRQCEALSKSLGLDLSQADVFRTQMSTALNLWLGPDNLNLGLRLEPPPVPSKFNGVSMVSRSGSGSQVQGLQSWILWGTDASRPRYQAEVET